MSERKDAQQMTPDELRAEITELETWLDQFFDYVPEPSELLDNINADYERLDLLRAYLAEFES